MTESKLKSDGGPGIEPVEVTIEIGERSCAEFQLVIARPELPGRDIEGRVFADVVDSRGQLKLANAISVKDLASAEQFRDELFKLVTGCDRSSRRSRPLVKVNCGATLRSGMKNPGIKLRGY